MKNNLKRKSGFTLLEILLVTGFISLASVGIYSAFNKAKIYYEIMDEVRNLDELRRAIIDYGQTQNSYAGLNNTLLGNVNVIPQNMRGAVAGQIVSIPRTPITVSSASLAGQTNNGFSIQYSNVDLERCARLQEIGAKYFQQVTINGFISKTTITSTTQTTSLNTVVNMCSAGGNNNTIIFTSITDGMNSAAVTTGTVAPVVASVKPIYSTPFAEEAFNSNPHVAESFKSRHWGVGTSAPLSNPTITISATPLALGYAAGTTPVTFTTSQRNVDIVNSALTPWYKSVLAANGGNIPASFSQPTFKNNPQWFLNVVALNTLADLAGAPRGAGLPAAMTSEIANFKTFIGPPLF